MPYTVCPNSLKASECKYNFSALYIYVQNASPGSSVSKSSLPAFYMYTRVQNKGLDTNLRKTTH